MSVRNVIHPIKQYLKDLFACRELLASSSKKENILQLNNATWEAADQIAFLSLISCFYHDVKGPLFCTKREICSVHLFHSWPLLWGWQQRSQLGSTLLVPFCDVRFPGGNWRDQYTSFRMPTSPQKEDLDAS